MKITIKDKIKLEAMIRDLAEKEGVTPAEIRQSMQETIDDAWDNKGKRGCANAWLKYFPDGKKPTLEEFLVRLASIIRLS